jgi:uncharacterized protein (DUF433 family)
VAVEIINSGHIVWDKESGSKWPRIAGTTITIHDVADSHNGGLSPDEISNSLNLTLAQVYAALSYYYDHKTLIDAEIEENEAMWDKSFAESQDYLEQLSREAHEAYLAGETEDFDPDIEDM